MNLSDTMNIKTEINICFITLSPIFLSSYRLPKKAGPLGNYHQITNHLYKFFVILNRIYYSAFLEHPIYFEIGPENWQN